MSPQPFWLKFISVLQFAMSGEALPPHRPFLVPPKIPARQPRLVPPRVRPAARPKVVAFLFRSGEKPTANIPDEERPTAAMPDEGTAAIPDDEKRPDEAKERHAAMIRAQEEHIAQIKRSLAEL